MLTLGSGCHNYYQLAIKLYPNGLQYMRLLCHINQLNKQVI